MKRIHYMILVLLCLCSMILLLSTIPEKVEYRMGWDSQKPFIDFEVNGTNIRVNAWLDEEEETYYFFCPSFAKEEKFGIEERQNDIPICFMKSSSIESMFIHTKSGTMDAIHNDKQYEEEGHIKVVSEQGIVEYDGALDRISGRGNSTWEYSKKPYSITLSKADKLCGLEKGKKWILLPLWREGNKMNTRVIFDIAQAAGLKYTPESTWVDLYLNDEYVGIYMLCESISVANGRVEIFDLEEMNQLLNPELDSAELFSEADAKGFELENNPSDISGGYLIEKDWQPYYDREPVGFLTNNGTQFTISAPKHASREQVYYVKDYIQRIEDLLNDRNEAVREYVEFESFALKYIIDELSLNIDTNVTSMYFYKERGSNLLCAGPVWDYDSALGECNSGHVEGMYVDYTNSVLDLNTDLLWYQQLMDNEEFRKVVRRKYKELYPIIQEIMNKSIDRYAALLENSIAMDRQRWKNEETDKAGNYEHFDSNVRYLKFFLCNRLNWLNEKLIGNNAGLTWEGNGASHKVEFWLENQLIETVYVQDGDFLQSLPELDDSYYGWYFVYNDEKYRDQLPILEDSILYAR